MKTNWALAFLQGAGVLALFWLSCAPESQVWQPPAGARDLLVLSPTGFVFACALYLGASAFALGRTGRPLAQSGSRGARDPVCINWLWISRRLLTSASAACSRRKPLAPWATACLGRFAVLAVFNAAVFLGIGFAMDRRGTRGLPLHALLLACAGFAAATPLIADAGGGRLAAIVAGTLSQAGLWAQTHLVTGALLDALRRRRPTIQLRVRCN